jgi:hypothetical protein
MHWFGNKDFVDVMNKHRQQNLKSWYNLIILKESYYETYNCWKFYE